MTILNGEKVKKIFLFGLLFASFGANPACADTYVSGSAGFGFLGNLKQNNVVTAEYDSGYALNGAVGYDFKGIRAEVAVGYQINDFDTFNGRKVRDELKPRVSILTVLANSYYDFSAGSVVKPYVTAGLGVANVEFSDISNSTNDTYFAWQVGGGIGFEVSRNISFDLGYRYLKPVGLTVRGYDASFESQNVLAGIRYRF